MSVPGQPRTAVVDLNLFVSGLLSSLGQPYRLICSFQEGAFTLIISRQLREELGEVMRREKFAARFSLSPIDVTEFLILVDATAIIVEPVVTVPVTVRDPKDEIVLATALGGNADFLVTGDADLLTGYAVGGK